MAEMSEEALIKATGKARKDWRAHIDGLGGKDMTHKEIASKLCDEGLPGWWAQMVTVEYERMTGRRTVGQRCDGKFSAAASKTFAGDKDAALERWQEVVGDRVEFCDQIAEHEPRISQSDNWRYWRVGLEDGSRAALAIYDKAPGRASVAMSHDKLVDADAAANAKAFWKGLLAEM